MGAASSEHARPAERARVLLAEDHPAMAAELTGLLATEYDVIAVVGDGQALIDATRATRPDVIVSDIAMPGMSGLTAADAILADRPDSRIVFVTVIADRAVILRARSGGALGYVHKGDAGDELLSAVSAALRGDPFVSSSAQLVLDDESGPA